MIARRLLIRPGAIGDLIVSLPALEFLRAPYTEVWVPSANVPLVRFADRVRAISSTGLDLLELGMAPPSLLQTLQSFDEIHSWYGASRAEFRQAASGLPFRFHAALPSTPDLHAADFYAAQAGAPLGLVPRIPIAAPLHSPPFAVIHPFSSSPRKNWPLAKFRQLAASLTLPAAWCAGPEQDLAGAHRLDDLGALAAWLKGASLYIGNDSGIAHLAAALGVPSLVLFGPTDPAVWAPRGPHVRVLAHHPLTSLPASTVASVALDFLRIN